MSITLRELRDTLPEHLSAGYHYDANTDRYSVLGYGLQQAGIPTKRYQGSTLWVTVPGEKPVLASILFGTLYGVSREVAHRLTYAGIHEGRGAVLAYLDRLTGADLEMPS